MTYGKTHVGNGLLAGFVATIALSAVMLMKQAAGLMPQLNPIEMITRMMGASSPLIGWIVHFMIGTVVWGILYAILDSRLPGRPWFRGALLATGAWLIMMVVMMPMAGAGMFGMALGLGMMAPLATLMMHWIFGAVLGSTFAALGRRSGAAHASPRPL